MDNYKIFLFKDNKKFNITSLCGNLAWNDSIENLSVERTFDFQRNRYDKYLVNLDILEIEDKILILNNDIEVFRGIITDVEWSMYSKRVTCLDYAFLLNKSKTIIQFYKNKASVCIEKVCKKFNVKVNIENIATLITKIYKDKTISEIITDILEQVNQDKGTKYFYEMIKDTLYIRKLGFETITATFQPASNIAPFDVMKVKGNISRSQSIQDRRNSILVVSNKEKSTRILAAAKDQKSIDKIGILQEVVRVDKKDNSKSTNTAKNKLKELNKVNDNISIELLGSDELKRGRLIKLTEKKFELDGTHLIKSTSHSVNNGIHKCTLELGVLADG